MKDIKRVPEQTFLIAKINFTKSTTFSFIIGYSSKQFSSKYFCTLRSCISKNMDQQ